MNDYSIHIVPSQSVSCSNSNSSGSVSSASNAATLLLNMLIHCSVLTFLKVGFENKHKVIPFNNVCISILHIQRNQWVCSLRLC